jgi:hypothetical protein
MLATGLEVTDDEDAFATKLKKGSACANCKRRKSEIRFA